MATAANSDKRKPNGYGECDERDGHGGPGERIGRGDNGECGGRIERSGRGECDAHSGHSGRGGLGKRERICVWAVRIAFLLVFIVNVQCALQFAIWPEAFAPAYELDGVGLAGSVAIQGIGIAFLMWNVTYPPFIVAPRRFGVLGWVIIAQQAVGLVGETALLLSLPPGHDLLASSIVRFIAFDTVGLVVMLAALGALVALRRM